MMKKLIIGSCIFLLLVGLVVGHNLFFNKLDHSGENSLINDQDFPPEDEKLPPNSPKDYSEIGAALLENESLGFLKCGLADADVVGLLGEADQKSKAVWGIDGEQHQTWNYHFKGIQLDMIKKGDGQVIKSIEIVSPCDLKTLRDIGIGSFKGQVMTAYEQEIDSEALHRDRNELVAGSKDSGIVFRFQNNQVVSIFLGTAAK